MYLHRHSLYMYTSQHINDILASIFNSNDRSLYGNFIRKSFSLIDIQNIEKDEKAVGRKVMEYWKFYGGKMMAAIWNPAVDFERGA